MAFGTEDVPKIIGISAGIALAVVGLVVGIVCCHRRRQSVHSADAAGATAPPLPALTILPPPAPPPIHPLTLRRVPTAPLSVTAPPRSSPLEVVQVFGPEARRSTLTGARDSVEERSTQHTLTLPGAVTANGR